MDPFIGEVRILPWGWAPKGWATCDGQILPISQNTSLFAILGTNFGGNGKSNFGLPNLQGRVPIGAGQGPGLSQRDLGEEDGSETVTLDTTDTPAHSHVMQGSNLIANSNDPTGRVLARPFGGGFLYAPSGTQVNLGQGQVPPVGGGLPHNNLQPYLTVSYCIALQGTFPPRQ